MSRQAQIGVDFDVDCSNLLFFLLDLFLLLLSHFFCSLLSGIDRDFAEVRVQRKMMQAWARSPIDFAQLISIVYVTLTVPEMNEFGLEGRSCKTFSYKDRWTQQVIDDMRSLCGIQVGRGFPELVDFKFAILFSGKVQHTHTHTHTW